MINQWFRRSVFFTILLSTPFAFAGPTSVPRPLPGDEKIWRVANQCSVNALYMLARLHGKKVNYAGIEDRLPVREKGTSLAEMRDCASEIGLPCRVFKTTPDVLNRCALPVIAHWEEQRGITGHYVLVVAVKDGWVEYIDGTTAITDVLPMTEFRKRWSGYLLVPQEGKGWLWWVYLAAAVLGPLSLGLALWSRRRGRPAVTPSVTPRPPETVSSAGVP
jgi:hypothetical protein